jgi:hypothetical protein
MSYSSGQGIDITLSASGDMDSNQYRFVTTASTAGRFQLSTGGSGPGPIGVLQNDPRSLDAGSIRVAGITNLMVEADTAIGYGDYITSGSGGQGVVAATAGSNAYYAVSLADVASGSGVIIPALLQTSQVAADNTP